MNPPDDHDCTQLVMLVLAIIIICVQCFTYRLQRTDNQTIMHNQEALYAAMCSHPIDATHDWGTKSVKDPNPR